MTGRKSLRPARRAPCSAQRPCQPGFSAGPVCAELLSSWRRAGSPVRPWGSAWGPRCDGGRAPALRAPGSPRAGARGGWQLCCGDGEASLDGARPGSDTPPAHDGGLTSQPPLCAQRPHTAGARSAHTASPRGASRHRGRPSTADTRLDTAHSRSLAPGHGTKAHSRHPERLAA